MNEWEKEVQESLLDSEEAVLKELEKQYKKTIRDIDAKIRILQSDELTQSKIYQVNYQKALKGQIETILETLHSSEFTTIQQYLSDSYTTGFVGTAYSLAGQGMPLILPIDQKAAVRAVLTDSKLSTDLYTALGLDIKKLKKSVSAEVTRGISAGRSYNDIANTLSTMTGTPYSNAKRIVRTEGHRIQQASTHDAAQAAKKRGADVVKQWDSILDGNTRPMHQRLDGQIRGVDKPFEMGGKKAMHPGEFGDPAEDCNCRCVENIRARWALDESELETLKERAEYFGLQDDEGKLAQFEDFKKNYLKAAETVENASDSQPFTPAKTIAEAKEYAEKQLGFTRRFDVSEMNIDDVNEINRTIAEIQSKYPNMPNVDTLLHFKKERYLAAMDHASLTQTKKFTGQKLTIGNAKTGDLQRVIWHEYGHLMGSKLEADEWLSATDDKWFIKYADASIKQKWYAGILSKARAIMKKDGDRFDASHISAYAVKWEKSKPSELFAECFAEYNTTKKPSKEAILIMKLAGLL